MFGESCCQKTKPREANDSSSKSNKDDKLDSAVPLVLVIISTETEDFDVDEAVKDGAEARQTAHHSQFVEC